MNYEKYVALIRKLESYAAADRKAYEWRVLGLALVGYAYFFGLIAIFFLIPAVVIVATVFYPGPMLRLLLWTAKLWFVAVPVLAAVFGLLGGAVKSLFTSVPEPQGQELLPDEAPELHEFVRSTCSALKAAVPEKVLVTDDFNASVITLPRFGIFGMKVYLSLGIPVMKALSPEQLKAVIAHEIGHISGKHGGFGKWAYQLHESWGRFIDSQEVNGSKFSALYDRFVKWFFPYFQAYTFVLMREHEKEADEYAVEVAGAGPLAEALLTLQTRSATLSEDFWPKLHEENQHNATPAQDVFTRMLGALAFVDPDRDSMTIAKALKVPTDYNDSHPSLSDRLRLIGYLKGDETPVPPPAPAMNAAQHFLGSGADRYIAEFEKKWSEEIAKSWSQIHEHFKATRGRLEELESKAGEEGLSVEDLIEKAALIAEQKGNKESLPLLREAYEKAPDNAQVNYLLGGVLLESDDESGLDLVKRSMQLDEKWKYAASDVAFQYLRSKGRLDEAGEFAKILESQAEEYENAQRERQQISSDDRFLPHELTEQTVADVVRKLRYYEEIAEIYLVRKDVQYLKDYPFNVLFIEMRKPSRFGRSDDMKPADLLQAIARRLEESEIGFFAVFDGELAAAKTKVRSIEDSCIFDRSKEAAPAQAAG